MQALNSQNGMHRSIGPGTRARYHNNLIIWKSFPPLRSPHRQQPVI